MRLHRIVGLALVVVSLAIVPLARHATLAWGFLALALGLVGVVLLLHVPKSSSRKDGTDPRDHLDAL